MSESLNEAKNRLHRVFSYIRELTKLRTPPLNQTSSYEWYLRYSSLPSYPTIQITSFNECTEEDQNEVVLRIKRPTETQCPFPPKILERWVGHGWEHLDSEISFLPAINTSDESGRTFTEKFDANPERVLLFETWKQERAEWQKAERPAREAGRIFSEFFRLQAQLHREAEKYQLYLGDGHLIWDSAIGPIDHPILLKKIELEFDPSVPEFILRETDESPELYTTLLRHHEIEGSAVSACKARLEEIEPHPLAGEKTVEFFKYCVQRFFRNGQYFSTRKDIVSAIPSVHRDPVIFLGNRVQGFAEALDRLIENIPNSPSVSEALFRIVGIDDKEIKTSEISGTDTRRSPEQKIDFLLTKPANKEQERVITQLERTGSVLVQGPPGTGKSHTIANVVGHLLASGKTVLVSSHTSKALKVVREKVADQLRPLCVSVLENDVESKAQLEESINGIVSYLSRNDEASLSSEIAELAKRRSQVKSQLEELEIKALEIRKGEYTDIIVAGESTPPSEAARKVDELEDTHGWIPGSMEYGAPLPLNEDDLRDLYSSNTTLSVEEEKCLEEELPDFDEILKASEFRELSNSIASVDREKTKRFSEFWLNANQDSTSLDNLKTDLIKTLELLSTHRWVRKVAEDSKLGKDHVQPWLNLIQLVNSTTQSIAKKSEWILKYGPKTPDTITPELVGTCREIVNHLRSGRSLGFLNTLFKSSWKNLIASCRVDEGNPARLEHFEAILAHFEIIQLRKELSLRWERQVCSQGGIALDSKAPEKHAKSFEDALVLATSWATSSWQKIEHALKDQFFNLKLATEKMSLSGSAKSYIDLVQIMIETLIIPAVEARLLLVRLKTLEQQKEVTVQALTVNSQKVANASAYLSQMAKALELLNPDQYEKAFNRYLEIKSKSNVFKKRKTFLQKLEQSATGWASAINLRSGVHGNGSLPGNAEIAWKVCQWRQEIDRRVGQDYSSVQLDIQRRKKELNEINAQYVEKLAWRYQLSRTGLKEKQALTGWQQLQSKITKSGRGKRDIHLKREARKTLRDCKTAVPVWIMPLSRVFDSFDLVHTKFDVVLIDEASQSDITALVAFAIAKQVIVVGDNEQVTPYAVGQELGKIQSLIDELLQGIPNRMLYDGKTSVYDLAEQAFGETIRLIEHFRCVPDIIQFSNQLSYNGEIKPLREASSSPYTQHLVSHRVDGATCIDKVNKKEAAEIASLVAAITEMEEYSNASIGIIAMVGHEQAIAIDSILQKKIPPALYAKHNLLCGNASQFQGDERDVIFLSMVDSCDSPPLSIRQSEDFKKTFNVAASRARNQLWVVHSLNPSTDLKPGDLRLRLIQHAENPKALAKAIEATQRKADPKSTVFEPMVIKDLMAAGFRITPQWEVGAYTIDMVVEGTKKRIAIECDGDRYHPPEKLADDIQRQMVLERLGWEFIRIRGSEYFRAREKTIQKVINDLDSLGIEKLGPKDHHSERFQIEQDEIQRKILQRAFEIRKDWEVHTEPEVEQKPRKAKARHKTILNNSTTPFEGAAAVKIDPNKNNGSPDSTELFSDKLLRKHTSPDHSLPAAELLPSKQLDGERKKLLKISKSRVVDGLACEKKIYLSIHNPDLKEPLSLSQQARLDAGKEVGALARNIFPNGILIQAEYWETEQAIAATADAIKNGHNTLYEASIGNSDFHCKVDILHRSASIEPWNIYEVKSGLSPKDEYILDLAVQCWILNASNVRWSRAYIVHLNRESKHPNVSNLFVHYDATDAVNNILLNLGNNIEKLKNIVHSSQLPEKKIGPHCDLPYPCSFKSHCWKSFPKQNVFDLPGIGPVKGWQLVSQGKTKIHDLDELSFKGKTQRAIQVVKSGKRWTNYEGIREGISALEWPLYFLDFETLAPVVPRYNGSSPYGEVPFQFSCHIWKEAMSQV